MTKETHDSAIGTPPVLSWIAVEKLSSDTSYQRGLSGASSKRVISKIAAGFDWALFQVVTVARDGDEYKLVDGQHRVAAARRRGVAHVPCLVVEGLSPERQARLFVDCNRNRVSVDPLTLHRSLLAAGDAAALETDRIARLAGVTIAPYPIIADDMPTGMTLSIASISWGVKRFDADVATAGLRLAAQCWAEPAGEIRAHRIRASIQAVADCGEDVVAKALARPEARQRLDAMTADEGVPLWRAIASEIAAMAGKPSKAGLPSRIEVAEPEERELSVEVTRRCASCPGVFKTKKLSRVLCDSCLSRRVAA